jgi:hypothetical protein
MRAMHNSIPIILVLSVVGMLACSKPADQPQPVNSQSNKNTTPTASAKKTTATGTIAANPNPIKVCDGTGSGVTTLTWSASGTSMIEVRMGSPDGGQFARTGPAGGTKQTGKWVGNGAVVYLQDVSEGKPLTSEYTIATLTINTTTQGCP